MSALHAVIPGLGTHFSLAEAITLGKAPGLKKAFCDNVQLLLHSGGMRAWEIELPIDSMDFGTCTSHPTGLKYLAFLVG